MKDNNIHNCFQFRVFTEFSAHKGLMPGFLSMTSVHSSWRLKFECPKFVFFFKLPVTHSNSASALSMTKHEICFPNFRCGLSSCITVTLNWCYIKLLLGNNIKGLLRNVSIYKTKILRFSDVLQLTSWFSSPTCFSLPYSLLFKRNFMFNIHLGAVTNFSFGKSRTGWMSN